MSLRSLLAASFVVVLCAATIQPADAYPVTARSGVTTVTGLYRPIGLNLILTDGTDALDYCAGCYGAGASSLTLTGLYGGTYTGYSLSGDAGMWRLQLVRFSTSGFGDDGNTIELTTSDLTQQVGTLRYEGGGAYTGLPYTDKPQDGDYFKIYATDTSLPYLQVDCGVGGTASCTSFSVSLMQNLKLLGPFLPSEGTFLDSGGGCYFDGTSDDCVVRPPESRVNQECYGATSGTFAACGNIAIRMGTPEPGSLALLGLGLAVLVIGRRRQPDRPHLR